MLHIQLGIRRQPFVDDVKRRHRERLGDHVGYSAGWIPACVGRNRSVWYLFYLFNFVETFFILLDNPWNLLYSVAPLSFLEHVDVSLDVRDATVHWIAVSYLLIPNYLENRFISPTVERKNSQFSDSSFLNGLVQSSCAVNGISLGCGHNKTFEDVFLLFGKDCSTFSHILYTKKTHWQSTQQSK